MTRKKSKRRRKGKGFKRLMAVSTFLGLVAVQRLVIMGVGLAAAYYVGRNATTDLALSAASLTLDAVSYCL